jgi:hypothetical protein
VLLHQIPSKPAQLLGVLASAAAPAAVAAAAAVAEEELRLPVAHSQDAAAAHTSECYARGACW